jgi:hypothetical protein
VHHVVTAPGVVWNNTNCLQAVDRVVSACFDILHHPDSDLPPTAAGNGRGTEVTVPVLDAASVTPAVSNLKPSPAALGVMTPPPGPGKDVTPVSTNLKPESPAVGDPLTVNEMGFQVWSSGSPGQCPACGLPLP